MDTSPLCMTCKHYIPRTELIISPFKCHAYFEGIPIEIITGEINHKIPYKNDNGIQYEPINNNIQKAKVYVKNPNEVPTGLKVQTGEKGGYYYESSNQKENLKQFDVSQYKNVKDFIKNNVKQLKEIGINTNESAQSLYNTLKLKNIKPKKISIEESINIINTKIDTNIHSGWFRNGDRSMKLKLFNYIIENNDVRNAGLNLMHDIYNKINNSNIEFNEFLNTEITLYRGGDIHTEDVFNSFSMDKRMSEKFSKDIIEIKIKPIKTLGLYQTIAESEVLIPTNFLNNNIKKAKIYVKNPNEVPQGAKLQQGERGGKFYETEEHEKFTSEVSDIETNIRNNMKFSESEIQEVDKIIEKHQKIANNEFQKIVNHVGGNVSYRVKNKYSILEKVRRKHKEDKEYNYSNVQDIFGVRVEVNNIEDIYESVKRLQSLYGDAIIEREDYVSKPKGVYRAYHMNIKYDDGTYGEIQIRTPLMDKIANASHVLLYKNTQELDIKTKQNIQETLNTYSNISVNKATIQDLKMFPKTKEILRSFNL